MNMNRRSFFTAAASCAAVLVAAPKSLLSSQTEYPIPTFKGILKGFEEIHNRGGVVLAIRINSEDVERLTAVIAKGIKPAGRWLRRQTGETNYLYGAKIQGTSDLPRGTVRFIADRPLGTDPYPLWFTCGNSAIIALSV